MWDMHVKMLSGGGLRNPPRQESGGSGGKSAAVVDAVAARGLFAFRTGLGTTQVQV